MAKLNKNRKKKIEEKITPLTDKKLPDGTRMYKVFTQTDEEADNAAKLARFLLRFIDRGMAECMLIEDRDDDDNVTGSGVVVYCKDDTKGDFIFTINSQYADKIDDSDEETSEVREKNVSLNEGETEN